MPDPDHVDAADKDGLDDEERAFQHAEESRDEEQDDPDDDPVRDIDG